MGRRECSRNFQKSYPAPLVNDVVDMVNDDYCYEVQTSPVPLGSPVVFAPVGRIMHRTCLENSKIHLPGWETSERVPLQLTLCVFDELYRNVWILS